MASLFCMETAFDGVTGRKQVRSDVQFLYAHVLGHGGLEVAQGWGS
jgi:hypothetical protein